MHEQAQDRPLRLLEEGLQNHVVGGWLLGECFQGCTATNWQASCLPSVRPDELVSCTSQI